MAAASPPEPPIAYEAIEALLADLRHEGVRVGAREEIAAARLIAELVARGAVSGPQELKPFLQPVIARTEEDRERFSRTYDRHFPPPDAPPPPPPPPTPKRLASAPAKAGQVWAMRAIAIGIVLIAAVWLAWTEPWRPREPPPPPDIAFEAPLDPRLAPAAPPPADPAPVTAEAAAWVQEVLNRSAEFDYAPTLGDLARDYGPTFAAPEASDFSQLSVERLSALTGIPSSTPQPILAEPWRLARIAYAVGVEMYPTATPPAPAELLAAAEQSITALLSPGYPTWIYNPLFAGLGAQSSAEREQAFTAAAALADQIAADPAIEDIASRQRALAIWNEVFPDQAVVYDDPNRRDDNAPWNGGETTGAAWWTPLVAAIVPLLFLLIWLTRSLERRKAYLRRRAADYPPALHELVAKAARLIPEEDRTVHRAAQTLQQWAFRDTDRLDVARTVERSLSEGRFTPRYAHARAQPDYLVLIETSGVGDQEAARLRGLVRRLEDRHIAMTVCYFERDPGIVHPEVYGASAASAPFASPPIEIEALALRYPQHRLLVLGGGEGLIDPVKGEPTDGARGLLAWPARAFLTSRPLAEWRAREFSIAQTLGLPIGRATADGLLALGGLLGLEGVERRGPVSFDGDGRARALPQALRERLTRWTTEMPASDVAWADLQGQLRRYLDTDGFAWLGACAVYPELRYDLTLYLGATVKGLGGEPLYAEGRLAALTQLPWFRMGRMPDWLRARLVEDLGPAAGSVRAALEQLIDGALLGGASAEDAEAVRLRVATTAPGSEDLFDDAVFVEFLAQARATDFDVDAIDPLRELAPERRQKRPRDPMAPAIAAFGVLGVAFAALTAPVGGKAGVFDWVNRYDGWLQSFSPFYFVFAAPLAALTLILLDRSAARIPPDRRAPEWALWLGGLGAGALPWVVLVLGVFHSFGQSSDYGLGTNVSFQVAVSDAWDYGPLNFLSLVGALSAVTAIWVALWLWCARALSLSFWFVLTVATSGFWLGFLSVFATLWLWLVSLIALALAVGALVGATRFARRPDAVESARERRRKPPKPRPILAVSAAGAVMAAWLGSYVFLVAQTQTLPRGVEEGQVLASTWIDDRNELIATREGYWIGSGARWTALADPAPVLTAPIARLAVGGDCLIAADRNGAVAVGAIENRGLRWAGAPLAQTSPATISPLLAVAAPSAAAVRLGPTGQEELIELSCDGGPATALRLRSAGGGRVQPTRVLVPTSSGWLRGTSEGLVFWSPSGAAEAELAEAMLPEMRSGPIESIQPLGAAAGGGEVFVATSVNGDSVTFELRDGVLSMTGQSAAPVVDGAAPTPAGEEPAETPLEDPTPPEAAPIDTSQGTPRLPQSRTLEPPERGGRPASDSEAILVENQRWSEARSADTQVGYRAYLRAYPQGRYVNDANAALARLDREAWVQAVRADTREAYEAYLREWPNGASAAVARQELATTPLAPACPTTQFVIYFEWDRSNLNAAAIDTIDQAVARARSCTIAGVQIDGHTDTSASAEYSLGLSQRMAATVRDAMVARGVPSGVIATSGYGETQLARATQDEVREPLNRRVEVTITFR